MSFLLDTLHSIHAKLVSDINNKGGTHGTLFNHLPIVQSSGSGKSRLVFEAGKSIFTISICLKKNEEAG